MQPLERHRLADEVERAEAQALAGLTLGGHAGHGDDRQARLAHGTQLQEVEAAHAGQVDVEDDRVRSIGLQLAERRLRASHEHGLVTELAQEVAKNLAQVGLVFDDQDAHGRGKV